MVGSRNWQTATASASQRLKWPISAIMSAPGDGVGGSLRYGSRSRLASFGTPFTSPLDGISNLWRHVVLIMLGEQACRHEHALRVKLPLCHHALPFLEQVGHQPLV